MQKSDKWDEINGSGNPCDSKILTHLGAPMHLGEVLHNIDSCMQNGEDGVIEKEMK
jgi:hypothetical protein